MIYQWRDLGICTVVGMVTAFLLVILIGADSAGAQTTGSIVGWGGQVVVPQEELSDLVAVEGGDYHSLGLKSDGSIVAWGSNYYGQCNVWFPNNDFVAISAGSEHNLGLKSDGSIRAWGLNGDGQCNVPSPNSDFEAVAGGGYHSLGLKSDGSIEAWGYNFWGQCNVPYPNSGFVEVAAGSIHSLGLKEDGSIVAWGANLDGECDVPSPNSDFVAVAAGVSHSLGLKSDGSIVAWGSNSYGQCDVPAPNNDFMAVAGGCTHSLGLKADGSIEAWGEGDNFWGQCDVPSPNSDFVTVAAGWEHSLGLKSNGSMVAWGRNDASQCHVPPPNSDFVDLAGGILHSLGLKSDGSIVAWGGSNSYGQCDVPAPNSDFMTVAGGWFHSLGLKSDGSIVAWGGNSSGQCDVPAPNSDFMAVAGGNIHSLGLKSDGSIVAWGGNGDGQCDVPAPNSDFMAIASGAYYSLGLKADGSVVAWGRNDLYIRNVPDPNTNFVAVAGGAEHCLGLKLPSVGTILVGPGPGDDNPTWVRGFDENGSFNEVTFFTAYPELDGYGTRVATGDLDGDFLEEVVTGPGPGPQEHPPRVRAFRGDGTPLDMVDIMAYGVPKYGVNVSCGDIDGDGIDEIVTGPGPGAVFGPHVRGWNVDGGTAHDMPGVSFFAYGTHKYGVNATCGDIDGDGIDEIVTGAGPGRVFGPHVRGWNVDGGITESISAVSYFAYGTHKWGVNVACGDIDGDGYDEIITGAGPGTVFGPHVRGWDYDGGASTTPVTGVSFLAYGTHKWGVLVACGDVDGDGIDEMITTPGPGQVFGSHVRGWNYDGEEISEIPELSYFAYDTSYRHGAVAAVAQRLYPSTQ